MEKPLMDNDLPSTLFVMFYSFIVSMFLQWPLQETLAQRLEKMTWKNRVVILYSDNATSTEYRLQKEWFAGMNASFAERDLVIIECIGSKLSAEDMLHLKNQFSIHPTRFGFRLIGKDGGVKLSSEKAIKPEQLFGLIDAMPMRRAEKKN